jgi:hypothetical protein
LVFFGTDTQFDVIFNTMVTEDADLIPHKHFYLDVFADMISVK